MATIADHLSVDALRERYVSSSNAREARHFHVIWLLAQGRRLQFRQGADLYAHARRFGGALDHLTGGGFADQGSRPAGRHFAYA
jgi:hypothetical protein